ncbi:acyl carrier protein [Paenibacillus sp. JGP012]|uniref:hypothetical protein n=1 Tax=Paenibacillus sp. JGP012 TaxID=2735914 RepID=UPI001617F9CE|nr:hypothetical protein [Paenibacillus sp. JGP012]MBB6022776.1 acyl carrier protein [Paenibacillus sp. JGP012]
MSKKYEELKEQFVNLLRQKGWLDEGKDINLENPIDSYLNSITYIQFIIAIEEAYDMEFEDEELDFARFNNFNDILLFMESKLSVI